MFDYALNHVWNHILAPHQLGTTGRLLAEVMTLIPDEDAPDWTPLTPYADDALSALAYCLCCLQSRDAQEAAWAARRVYEALDHFVISRGNILPSEAGAELRALSDPMIQAELARQARDMADLISARDSLSPALLDKLRQRSEVEPAITIAH